MQILVELLDMLEIFILNFPFLLLIFELYLFLNYKLLKVLNFLLYRLNKNC
jgi:hypothetical protein